MILQWRGWREAAENHPGNPRAPTQRVATQPGHSLAEHQKPIALTAHADGVAVHLPPRHPAQLTLISGTDTDAEKLQAEGSVTH